MFNFVYVFPTVVNVVFETNKILFNMDSSYIEFSKIYSNHRSNSVRHRPFCHDLIKTD